MTDPEIRVEHGDSREVLRTLADCNVDSCVTDPPYALTSIRKRFGKVTEDDDTQTSRRSRNRTDAYARTATGFMNKDWDVEDVVHDPAFWAEVYRVLKPGAHLVAFGGTRTYHRMVCAIEDAGFEIRDQLCWLFATGFPKSHDVSKGIDRIAGIERDKIPVPLTGTPYMSNSGNHRPWMDDPDHRVDSKEPATDEARLWHGWGTALKPAFEPIVLARKPISESSVAANVLRWGTGAINVDGCRIGFEDERDRAGAFPGGSTTSLGAGSLAGPGQAQEAERSAFVAERNSIGRWPANVAHDGSDEVVSAFPDAPGALYDVRGTEPSGKTGSNGIYSPMQRDGELRQARTDSGSAARFFFSAKADVSDRLGSKHPTVKPLDLMRWLVTLVTPPGGTVLDPFAGTGTTGIAARAAGFESILVERDAAYVEDIRQRIDFYGITGKKTRAPKSRVYGTLF